MILRAFLNLFTMHLPTFCCWRTLKLPRVHTKCSLLWQEGLLIREGSLLYWIVRRIPKPGHPLVLLLSEVGGISGRRRVCSGRSMEIGDLKKSVQQQLCSLLTWKHFWCLMIITRQLHASLLLRIKIGMGYSYASWLTFPHVNILWTRSTLG